MTGLKLAAYGPPQCAKSTPIDGDEHGHPRRAARPAPGRGPSAALDFAAGSHKRAAALLVLFSLIAFLPGFFQIPPVDRDEARFAQATKQMLETGQYVDIRFQDEVRYKKPVGIYWLQALAVKAGGRPACRIRAPPSGSTACPRCSAPSARCC